MISTMESKFYLGFSRISCITPRRFALIEKHFPSFEIAWTKGDRTDFLQAGLDQSCVDEIMKIRKSIDLNREQYRLERDGVRLLTCHDLEYPRRLKEIHDYPYLLYVKGEVSLLNRPCVSIVGTRKSTSYGIQVTELLSQILVANDVVIASGAARGIDAMAHQASVKYGGQTIVVLGTGLDRMYPAEHRRWLQNMTDNNQAVMISELPYDTELMPHHFPRRNRIIAGLSAVTIIVEAGEKSGALITAQYALDENRDVFAVPGPITSPQSDGTNRLIKDGAIPLTKLEDILEFLGIQMRSMMVARELPVFSDPCEKKIYELLSSVPLHIDQLARTLRIPSHQLGSVLIQMELRGVIRDAGGMRFVRGA